MPFRPHRRGRRASATLPESLDALDQQLQLGLLLCFFLLRYLHDFFQLVGVGLGQVEGQLCTGRANQFVQNAGSQNNGLQNIAGLAAEGTGTHCCQTDGNTILRNQGKTQIVADQFAFAGNGTADKSTGILANDTDQEVDHANVEQRHRADALRTVHRLPAVQFKGREPASAGPKWKGLPAKSALCQASSLH